MKIFQMALPCCFLLALVWASEGVAQTEGQPAASQEKGGSKGGSDSADSDEWIKMAPSGAWATFEVPERPRYVERSFKPVVGREAIKVKLHIARSSNGLSSYVFSYHDMLEHPADRKTIDSALEGAMRGSLATVNGRLLAVPEAVRYKENGPLGRQFRYEFEQNEKKFEVISRIFLVKQRQYQLSVIMAQEVLDPQVAQYFLDSFRIVLPEPDLPPEPRLNR